MNPVETKPKKVCVFLNIETLNCLGTVAAIALLMALAVSDNAWAQGAARNEHSGRRRSSWESDAGLTLRDHHDGHAGLYLECRAGSNLVLPLGKRQCDQYVQDPDMVHSGASRLRFRDRNLLGDSSYSVSKRQWTMVDPDMEP